MFNRALAGLWMAVISTIDSDNWGASILQIVLVREVVINLNVLTS